MINKSTLKARGWTEAIIQQLLGEPDKTRRNPRGRYPICLFEVPRVVAAEASPEFLSRQSAAKLRRERQLAIFKIKFEENLRLIGEMSVQVTSISREELTSRAISEYNSFNADREKGASADSDPEFIERICFNFVRHNLTRYDMAFEKTVRQAYRAELNYELQSRFADAIVEVYDWLSEAADKYLERKLYNLIYE